MDIEQFCEKVLCNFDDTGENLDNDKLQKLWSCDWVSLLSSPNVKNAFNGKFGNTADENDEKWNLLISAIACLLTFVQQNFSGPDLEQYYNVWIKENLSDEISASDELNSDGEQLNPNVKLPEFLLMAKNILDFLLKKNPNSMVLLWWKLRQLCIHQQVLDDLAQSIFSEFSKVVEELSGRLEELEKLELKALLLDEISIGFLTFHRTQKSNEYLERVCRLLEIELKVEGLLGVRTKFQEKHLPQLCLKVQQNAQNQLQPALKTHGSIVLPKLLALDDDVLLERIRFDNENDNATMTLPSIIQLVILTKLKLLLKSQPKDKLADEEVEPYIKTLMYQEHGPLSVRLSVLLLNVRQEKDKRRTVERSLKQCEETLKFIEGDKFSVFDRLSYYFASFFTPIWEVQKQLGDLMVSLGLIKSALDLYLKIQEWEDVIECYTRMDLRHKAAEIIQQELEKKPNVKLYCLLGDATDDVSCYEIAWKLSKETSGRAQRHWGCYFFAKKDYEKALPHLQKSLEINSLQEVVWLRLGYAAIMLEKWELAVHAYLTYTHINPYGFESWNNLAKALINLGDKKRAHKILGEALKCNYNNSKVWENFMLVSVDTGNFEDAINSYSRLNELKEKFIDLEVIEIVANSIAKNTLDAQGRPSERLRKKCNALLGHQCVQHPSEYKLWELSALLAESPLSRAQKYLKCYYSYTQKHSSWVSAKDPCLVAMNICKKLCEASLQAIDNHEESEKTCAISQLSSTRLATQMCERAIQRHPEKCDEFTDGLNDLQSYSRTIVNNLRKEIRTDIVAVKNKFQELLN